MRLKKALFGNIGLKLLSVAVAISLWFFITYRGQTETTIEAQVDFKNIPHGLEILKQNIKKVSISVRGHEMILSGLKPSDVRLVVDLSSGKKGEASYYFDASDVKLAQNVKVQRIDPTYVRVTLDESQSKNVEIKPYIVGQPAAGYAVHKITVEPASVILEGAKTEMARLAVLRTEPLDITGLDASFSQNVRIDTNGRNVRIKTPDVTVRVVIGRIK